MLLFGLATNRPLIIFHHGGSYYQGSKNNPGAVDFCMSFAKRGYVSVSANYRLVSLLDLISFESGSNIFGSISTNCNAIEVESGSKVLESPDPSLKE